jgi:hypothetical protein
MSRETCTVDIGGTSYQITQLGAKAARRIELRCARLIVAGLKVPDASAAASGDTAAIEAVLTAVAAGLSDDDLDMVCEQFAEATKVRLTLQTTTGALPSAPVSLSAIFDDHFAGANHVNMWRWLAMCFKINFASFLGELGTLIPGLKAAKASEPQPGPMSSSGA